MITDMFSGRGAKKKAYELAKQQKAVAKSKENTREPKIVEEELAQCSAMVGQKHHQIECLKYELKQFTIRMNELLLELKSSKDVYGEPSEHINVVP